MGKYRLQSRNKNSMITLMEVDTECRAWYIKADDRNAAVRALKAMGKELTPVESIYVNGEDVSDEVFAAIALDMGAPSYKEPEDSMPSGDMGVEDIPLPDEEPMENFALPPDEMALPTLDDIPPDARRCRRRQAVYRKWICRTFCLTLPACFPRVPSFPLLRTGERRGAL